MGVFSATKAKGTPPSEAVLESELNQLRHPDGSTPTLTGAQWREMAFRRTRFLGGKTPWAKAFLVPPADPARDAQCIPRWRLHFLKRDFLAADRIVKRIDEVEALQLEAINTTAETLAQLPAVEAGKLKAVPLYLEQLCGHEGRLNITPETLRRWEARGKLKIIDVFGRNCAGRIQKRRAVTLGEIIRLETQRTIQPATGRLISTVQQREDPRFAFQDWQLVYYGAKKEKTLAPDSSGVVRQQNGYTEAALNELAKQLAAPPNRNPPSEYSDGNGELWLALSQVTLPGRYLLEDLRVMFLAVSELPPRRTSGLLCLWNIVHDVPPRFRLIDNPGCGRDKIRVMHAVDAARLSELPTKAQPKSGEFRIAAAALELGCSEIWVRNQINSGQLKTVERLSKDTGRVAQHLDIAAARELLPVTIPKPGEATIDDAADTLGISPDWLRSQEKEGRLATVDRLSGRSKRIAKHVDLESARELKTAFWHPRGRQRQRPQAPSRGADASINSPDADDSPESTNQQAIVEGPPTKAPEDAVNATPTHQDVEPFPGWDDLRQLRKWIEEGGHVPTVPGWDESQGDRNAWIYCCAMLQVVWETIEANLMRLSPVRGWTPLSLSAIRKNADASALKWNRPPVLARRRGRHKRSED